MTVIIQTDLPVISWFLLHQHTKGGFSEEKKQSPAQDLLDSVVIQTGKSIR